MTRWQDDLQFYSMHFMPYIDFPPDLAKYDSLSVDYSNTHFDPHKGAALYQRYVAEMVLADKLGYDGLVLNEHHATAYGMMPACNIMAATLAARTERAKICVFGVPITLMPPVRLAEEYAMLDLLSGGRVEIAIPLGIGMEYWANNVNPTTARARFREAVAVLIQAWTVPGPSSFEGEFYNYRYLNVWPQPLQKPHPKINMLGTGSPETMDYAAEKGWGYASVFVPRALQIKSFRNLREMFAKHGHTWTPDKALVNTIVYVGETDEIAEREGKEHIRCYFEDLLRTTPRFLLPPGYVSPEQLRVRATATKLHGGFDWDAMTQQWRIVVGSPRRVADSIAQWCEEVDSSRVILHHHIGDMPHWKVVKNMTLFAEEVLPRLRPAAQAAVLRAPALAGAAS
jgi:alkanesulfonate monooxygenase SsuD/methylene tetrahydromethanopterin reductase-like flavin-dependent oxidoreductase (luciferase family)